MDLCDRWKQNSLWVKSVVLDVLDDVRFTPESDRLLQRRGMTLCAISDQSALQQFGEAKASVWIGIRWLAQSASSVLPLAG